MDRLVYIQLAHAWIKIWSVPAALENFQPMYLYSSVITFHEYNFVSVGIMETV